MEENRLDSLIHLLNEIGKDRVMRRTDNDVTFSYEFGNFTGTEVLEIYFKRKTDKTKTNIIRLTSEDKKGVIDAAASMLLRYIIFAKRLY